MKKVKQALVVLLCVVLLMSLTVAGTLAYLASTTKEVVNTFTVGQVKITLDEGDIYEVGETGATPDKLGTFKDNGVTRVQENKYKLMPGHDLDKDPTVHVQANSEECYVRAFVTVNNFADLKTILKITDDDAAAAAIATYATGYDASVWEDKGWEIEDDTVTYEFRVKGIVPASASVQDYELFNKVTVPGTLTNQEILLLSPEYNDAGEVVVEGLKINVIAHAIQADGFTDADDAWTKWNPADAN